MVECRALWVSTSVHTRGGVATYVRELQQTQLWDNWNIRHVVTHVDGAKATKLMAFLRGMFVFSVELVRFRPTVIHLHSSSGASFVRKSILFWLSRFARVPVVIHMHGFEFQSYYRGSSRIMQLLIRLTLGCAAAVVALGEVWAERLKAIAPSANVTVIPNAVRPASRVSQPPRGEPVSVVFLGRIGDRKGALRLLDAWSQLISGSIACRIPEGAARLTIAGDGEVELARRRISELDLESCVEVHDWLPQDAVARLLDRSHVLVLPSRSEGQPMAVLEAMARGLCVISSDAGGLAEMVGNGGGVIVPPDDIDAISEALRHVINDSDARVRYGSAAYERCQNRFDVGAVAREVDSLYRSVIC